MMSRTIIHTNNAPAAIGTYSQAVKVDQTVYISGQIALDPETMEMVEGEISNRIHRAFKNLSAICDASGGNIQQIVKLNIFLTDLQNFAIVNEIMAEYFEQPYPARAAVGVAELPKGTDFEVDAVLYLDD